VPNRVVRVGGRGENEKKEHDRHGVSPITGKDRAPCGGSKPLPHGRPGAAGWNRAPGTVPSTVR
jgi:hypothetical protein